MPHPRSTPPRVRCPTSTCGQALRGEWGNEASAPPDRFWASMARASPGPTASWRLLPRQHRATEYCKRDIVLKCPSDAADMPMPWTEGLVPFGPTSGRESRRWPGTARRKWCACTGAGAITCGIRIGGVVTGHSGRRPANRERHLVMVPVGRAEPVFWPVVRDCRPVVHAAARGCEGPALRAQRRTRTEPSEPALRAGGRPTLATASAAARSARPCAVPRP